jgi:serine/threonine protein kinase
MKDLCDNIGPDSQCRVACLPAGTLLLRDQYRIEQPLINGGFGITYLARDSLNRQVVVKECYPEEICQRTQNGVCARSDDMKGGFAQIKRQFKREAHRLANLQHPNIVGVHQVFEENGTVYLVMDFVEGLDLQKLIETEPERLAPELLKAALIETLEAVRYIHDQGLLHHDIAPDNLILGKDGRITLIDFGSSVEQDSAGDMTATKMLVVKEGYSPHEAYCNSEPHDVTTDLYSVGATFHLLITGEIPTDSHDRLATVARGERDPYRCLAGRIGGFDDDFLACIDQALALFQTDRIRSASEWLDRIAGATAAAPASAPASGAQGHVAADISNVISQLVNETNMAVSPGLPKALRDAQGQGQRDEGQDRDSARPKQRFDIFGNPIEDVEAYLQEEHKRLAGRNEPNVAARALDEPQSGIEENREDTPRSTIVGKLGRLISGRRTTIPSTAQT